jgi:hypothetical protein
MPVLCALITIVVTAPAADVTSAASRKENLLDYVAGRTDLAQEERSAWETAVRASFGGKALKDGTDEGVTAAKSVIAGAIFFGIPPQRGATAAYDAYHDTYRWVPPPIAVNYQLLVFQGKKPSASTRELAYDFPRWFNQDLAPDLVVWWDAMLSNGAIKGDEARAVQKALAATRAEMRPMLLEQLWRGVELEARQAAAAPDAPERAELDAALADLARELERAYRGVAKSPAVEATGPYYPRYRALAQELKKKPRAAPAGGPRTEAPRVTTRPPPKTPKPTGGSGSLGFAEVGPRAEPLRNDLVPAPLPGDALIAVPTDYARALASNVDSWIGTPYLWGGTSRRGIDCSAFVKSVFLETFGIDLPRNARVQATMGVAVKQDDLLPGDLIFFDTLDRGAITHVGLYVGDGKLAHASSHFGVTRAQLEKQYYQRAYRGSRRIIKM